MAENVLPDTASTARAANSPATRKGIPGLSLYRVVFPTLIAANGGSVSLAVLVSLAAEAIEAFAARATAEVAEIARAYAVANLPYRTRQFFKEISNRARGIPTFSPFPVPGRAGGIVFGARLPNGDATLKYDSEAVSVSAPELLGSVAETPAPKGKKKK